MTTTPTEPAPVSSSPFEYIDDGDGGQASYFIDAESLPEVRAEEGTGEGELTFRTPNGSLAATNISTSTRLYAAAAESLALAHAVAAYEDAQRDAEQQAARAAAEVQA